MFVNPYLQTTLLFGLACFALGIAACAMLVYYTTRYVPAAAFNIALLLLIFCLLSTRGFGFF